MGRNMQLYLVKWSDGSFALIRAADEDDLVDTLDQLADPAAASWQVYDGPLWLEFPPLREALSGENAVAPHEIGIGSPHVAETDDGEEFTEAVLSAIHPNLLALRDRAFDEDRLVSRAEANEALAADDACALPGSVYGASGDDVEH